jgi:hypothetical protein
MTNALTSSGVLGRPGVLVDRFFFDFGVSSAFIQLMSVAGETMVTSSRRISLDNPRAALTSARHSSGVVRMTSGSLFRILWFSVFRK